MLRRYVASLLLSSGLAISSLAGVGIALDPLDVFVSFTDLPYPIRSRAAERTAKTYAVRARKPDALILGTSRAEWGYRTSGPPWDGHTPYNLGLPSAHIYEVRRYLQHAAALAKPKVILLALDPVLFAVRRSDWSQDFTEQRLAVGADGRATSFPIVDLLGIALSVDLYWKNRSVLADRKQWALSPLGHIELSSLMAEGRGSEPARINFEKRFQTTLDQYKPERYEAFADQYREALAELGRILILAKDHGTEIVIVINPVHVTMLEVLKQHNLLETQFRWTVDVVRAVAEFERANGVEIPVWNFCTVNELTSRSVTEQPLQQAIPELMFMDPGHFSQLLGARIQAQAFAGAGPSAEFGYKLSPGNVSSHLADQSLRLARWAAIHPEDRAWVTRVSSTLR